MDRNVLHSEKTDLKIIRSIAQSLNDSVYKTSPFSVHLQYNLKRCLPIWGFIVCQSVFLFLFLGFGVRVSWV